MYQYILFDLDGTLTDSGPGITNSVAYALKKLGIEVPDRAELYKFIGPPLYVSFRDFYGLEGEENANAVSLYREYYEKTGIFENSVYDGIPEVLETLKAKGKRLILSTSKPEPMAHRILEHFDLMKYFDVVVGATLDSTRAKKVDVIRYTLLNSGIKNIDEAVMIGDRDLDIKGAKENGIDSIGVLYGFGSREELETAGALRLAETPEEILNFLE